MQIHSLNSNKINSLPHFNGAFIVEGTPDEIKKVDEKAIDEFYKDIESPLNIFAKNKNRRFQDFERINLIQQDNPISQRLYMTNDEAPVLRFYKERFSVYKIFGLSVDSKSPLEELFENGYKKGDSEPYLNLMLNKHLSKNPEYIPQHKHIARNILHEFFDIAYNKLNKKIKIDEIPVIKAKEILNSKEGILFDFVKGVFKIAHK